MKKLTEKILVTKSVLPPIDAYMDKIKHIWSTGHLTNFGPNAMTLEQNISTYLESNNTFLVANGTLALQIAIKALDLKGEIITTPFSYVATTSSIAWETCRPVFADIDENYLTPSVKSIESKITPQTSAILITHVYGYPCDIEGIERLAEKYKLKVIYDAAHAFGAKYKGKSLGSFGDVSTLSFHATKVFHSVEGGAIICKDKSISQKVDYLRNFGHKGPEAFQGIGINAKMSEFHAAMGLCIFPEIESILAARNNIAKVYDDIISKSKSIRRPAILAEVQHNGAYYPIIFNSQTELLKTRKHLEELNVFTRRYFFPSLSHLPYVAKSETPVADKIAETILCLPIYPSLEPTIAEDIAQEVLKLNP